MQEGVKGGVVYLITDLHLPKHSKAKLEFPARMNPCPTNGRRAFGRAHGTFLRGKLDIGVSNKSTICYWETVSSIKIRESERLWLPDPLIL